MKNPSFPHDSGGNLDKVQNGFQLKDCWNDDVFRHLAILFWTRVVFDVILYYMQISYHTKCLSFGLSGGMRMLGCAYKQSLYITFRIVVSLLIIPSIVGAQSSDTNHKPTHDPYKEIGAPLIRNYTPREYKAFSQNWAIAQDRRGVMYFGNTSGVLEFDGSNWRLIYTSKKKTVRSLAVGRNGTIYVGCVGEIGYLASDSNGEMQHISLLEKIPKKDRISAEFFSTYSTNQGVYFIAPNVIYRYYKNEIDTIQFQKDQFAFGWYVNEKLYLKVREEQKRNSLYRIDGIKLIPIPLPTSLVKEDIYNILPYAKDRILVSTIAGNFYVFDPVRATKNSQNVNSPKICKKLHTEIGTYLHRNQVYLGATKYGDWYVFNTLKGGIVIMDKLGKLVRAINKNRGLLDNCVFCVFTDRDNNLWAGMNKGIVHIELSSPLSVYNALSGPDTMILAETRAHGRLYIAGFDGVFVLMPYVLNSDDHYKQIVSIKNLPSKCSFVIAKMHDRLYAFPQESGIFQINDFEANLASKTFFPLVMSISKSKKFPNHLFLGMQSLGLGMVEFDPITGKVLKILYNEGNYAKFHDTVIKMFGDKRGDIWVAGESGVYQMHFTGESPAEFELIHHDAHDLQLGSTSLLTIEGQIVFRTTKGLYTLAADPSKEAGYRFVPISKINNINIENHEKISRIIGQGNNKIITEKPPANIAMLRKGKDGNYHWDDHSLRKIEGSPTSAYVEPDDTIWIGTSEGLYRFDSKIGKSYEADYHALIRNVVIGNNEVVFKGAYHDPESKQDKSFPISSTKQPSSMIPTLPYTKNNIAFKYSATFYEQIQEIRYSYLLEGFDQGFSEWTTKPNKDYTNLPEGDYRFVVKAKNIFDHESKPAIYAFSILPPWYRTTLAYFGYVGIFFFIMYAGIRINNRRLIAAKKRLEKIVLERTAQVRKQKDQLEIKNKEISEAYTKLEETHLRLKNTQNQLLDASWKAGMADVASNVLHNVGNALNSVNVSKNFIQDNMHRSKIQYLGKATEIINNPEEFPPQSVRAQKASEYLTKLVDQLNKEHKTSLEEIRNLGENLERVSSIVAAQQKYTHTTGLSEQLTPKELIEMAIEMSLLSTEDVVKVGCDYRYNEAIHVQRHKVIQILINLLHNAKKSLKSDNQDKNIQIIANKMDDNRIQIEVKDNGEGLKADTLSRIFTFDMDDTSQGKDLDLHASANAAKSIGGSLSATSDGPGKGSSFVLELPIA